MGRYDMKVRQGFVSNSSSSSFIIAFREKPSSQEELQKLLFGDAEILEYLDDYNISTKEAAQIVFGDLTNPVGEKEILEELDHGTPYGDTHLSEPQYPYHLKYGTPEYEKAQEVFEDEQSKYHKNIADNFMAKTKGMSYYIVEYCDNDGQTQCTLEHGGTFDNIPHIRVSKH